MPTRSRVASAVLATLGLSATFALSTAPPASAAMGDLGQPQVVVNPGGGQLANGTDGLRFMINRTGSGFDEVWFAGTTQYCCTAGAPMLNIGGTLVGQAGAAYMAADDWSSLEVVATHGSASSSGGTALGSGSAHLRYTATVGGLDYVVDRTLTYTYPNDFVTEDYEFTIPDGNVADVEFYLGGDTAPGGSDSGYGIMVTEPVRSVISLNPNSGIQFGFREVPGGRAFDGATAQHYSAPFGTQQAGGDIGFVVTTALHDAGLAMQWHLGSTPGTYAGSLQEFANFQGTNLTADFASGSVASGATVDLDLNVINTELDPRSPLGFTAALPAGLEAAGVPGNTCGGTVTVDVEHGTVTLADGAIAATANCVVSVPVTAAVAGYYSIGAGSITIPVESVLTNGVGSRTLEVTGDPVAPTAFTDPTLGSLTRGTGFADGVTANGYPAPTYSVTSGALPAGLTLDPATGEITGTPTAAGPYSFTVTATNGGGSVDQGFTGEVTPSPTAPSSWIDDTFASIVAGVSYGDAVAADGYPAPTYSVTSGALPAGLSLDPATGRITGTATALGDYTVVITATNASGSIARTFTGTVIGGADDADLRMELDVKTGQTAAGAPVRVQGTGLKPSSDVVIELHSTPVHLATVQTDATGSFDTTVTLPAGIGSGTHHVVASGVAPDGSPVARQAELFVDFSGSYSDPGVQYGYRPVAPQRVLDTRSGAPVAAGHTYRLAVTPGWNVPGDATAVALNVTVTEPAAHGYVTVFPCGDRPEASALNFDAGQTVANLVVVPVPTDEVCLYTTADAHLVADLAGSFDPASTDLFHAQAPVRIADTRRASRLEAGQTLRVPVTADGRAPADAAAVVLNVTADRTAGEGYLTVYPCGGDVPLASNLNVVAGTTVANQVFVAPGTAGEVCVYASAPTDVIVDLDGSFGPGSGTSFLAMVAGRISDSRRSALLQAGTVTEFTMLGDDRVPTGATAVALNVTVTEPQAAGYLTVYPCASERPDASNVNFGGGQDVPNHVTAALSGDGKVCVYTSATTHVLLDVEGGYVNP